MQDVAAEPLKVMVVERKDGTCALRLCLDQGLLTREMMRTLDGVMDRFGLTDLRTTTGQRMNLEGVPADQLDAVVEALGARVPKCPPGISVCAGGEACKLGVQPTREITDRLLQVLKANAPYPFKVKSGVSGCIKGCAQSFVRDIGLIGGASGWSVYYGGSARQHAAPGVRLGKGLSVEEALALVERGLQFYKEHGNKRERIGMMVRRLGNEAVLEALS